MDSAQFPSRLNSGTAAKYRGGAWQSIRSIARVELPKIWTMRTTIRHTRSFLAGLILILGSLNPLPAQSFGSFLGGLSLGHSLDLPDSSPARIQQLDLLEAPLFELHPGLNQVITDPFMTHRVRFRVEVDNERGFSYLIFENEVKGTSAAAFPLVAPGNMIIRRTHNGGAIDQIKLFLGQGPHVYLRFFPMGVGQTRVSFFAYDDIDPLTQDLILPLGIRRIYSLSWKEIYALLAGNWEWQAFLAPDSLADYRNVEAMVHTIRPRLSELPDAEDGAMDEFGRLVKIESLFETDLPGFNCSGFAKWVADGIYQQATGRWMTIGVLKEKHYDLRGSAIGLEYEDLRDPYFGLDWTRNIATELARASYGRDYGPEDSDVRNIPFFEYTEDLGFAVPELWQIMYILAITEPGYWYLGSINGEFGQDPVLWQHYHVVVFFPYFDSDGQFRVAVMERNVESGIDSLIRRYPKDFVHLVRIPAAVEPGYEPPRIQIAAP